MTSTWTAAPQSQQAAEQAAREAQLEAQQAAREAQREALEAQREAQAAAREAAQEARDAARDAVREALRTRIVQGRAGEAVVVQQGMPPWMQQPRVPEEVVVISIAFFVMCAVIAIGIPIARAFARRMDRRSAVDPQASSDVRSRLERIEHAVDAIAIEVERVSEAQRYSTKILSGLRALPEPNAIEANALSAVGRERERQR
jgi:hypothetical protein